MSHSKQQLPQAFCVSHLKEEDFKQNGLRPYAKYRDLGIAMATSGLAQAHVIRFIPPHTPEAAQLHYHEVNFQMIYVLEGWVKTKLEGEGEHIMKKGSCWIQPSGIPHAVLDYSNDVELLEIILPADFNTVVI